MKKLLLIVTGVLALSFTTIKYSDNLFEITKQVEIFTTMFKELNLNYVDQTNPGELMDNAIRGMLSELDPYTKYMDEQQVEEFKIKTKGRYSGIGAKVRSYKDYILIVEPYEGKPADRAGLKAGDKITKVDNVFLKNMDKNVINDLLKGAPNSEINIEFERQGKTKKATVKRSTIEINAVPYYELLKDNVGYIAMVKFNKKAYEETKAALIDLKQQGAEKLILDLRGNPGGLLNQSIDLTNLFIPKGIVVTTTKSKVKKFNKTFATKKEPVDTEIPLVVLINGRSASASEIVSGGLQDLDRAVIIGNKSFGKGLVQRPKELTYGTQLKVTISRYHTPSGRCIQELDYWNRDDAGKATKAEKRNEFKTKNGRPVFDGGGITPDIEIKEGKYSAIAKSVLRKNTLFDFATDYYYKNQKPNNIEDFKLNANTFSEFKKYLKNVDFNYETSTEKELKKVLKTAEKEEYDTAIKSDYTALLQSLKNHKEVLLENKKEEILKLISDELVKRYFYKEGLYEYNMTHDPEIKKAIEILNSPKEYNRILGK